MRATVASLAPRYGLTGWVRNLSDGRVEICAEGLQADLERFMRSLKEHMPDYIHDTKGDWGTGLGRLEEFPRNVLISRTRRLP